MGIISTFVVITVSLFILVGIDVNMHKKDFAASLTGRKLKEYGGYEYGLLAYEQASLFGNKSAQWASENLPEYMNSTSEYLEPYIRLSRDLSLIAYNLSKQTINKVYGFVTDNYPIAEYWYLYYIGFCMLPGPISSVIQAVSIITHLDSVFSAFKYLYYIGFCMLPGPISSVIQAVSIITHLDSVFSAFKAQKNLPIVRDYMYHFFDVTKAGAATAVERLQGYSATAVDALQKNVFTGNLSPENLQKYAKEAYNYTGGLASETIGWVYEKVQSLSK